MDEEMIRRLLNREYPNTARNSSTRARSFSNGTSFCGDLPQQSHVHEFEGATLFVTIGNVTHNHRFAGVTSEVIPLPCGEHKHAILTNTDSFGHHHEIAIETGPAIDVGNGKHVHFVSGETTLDDFHFHEFQVTTAIQNPLVKEGCNCTCTCTCERSCERSSDRNCERNCSNR